MTHQENQMTRETAKENQMTRETAKEKREREEAERLSEKEAAILAYPQRFRAAVSAALTENFELSGINVESGEYFLIDRDSPRGSRETFTAYDTFSEADYRGCSLADLEDAIQHKKEQREEAQRKYEFRRATLAKLTKEEREALGV